MPDLITSPEQNGGTLMSLEELNAQLSPSLSAKDAPGTLQRHVDMTDAVLRNQNVSVDRDLEYGPSPRERLDVVRPVGRDGLPCLIIIHGGFWQEGSKAASGFASEALAAHGWATALLGYTLAPQATLPDIVAEIGRAISYLAENAEALGLDESRLFVAGHSAGAHLTAAALCGKAGSDIAARIAGAVLISGVYDLEPIAASYVDELVGMTEEDVAQLSILQTRPATDVPVHILVGADETDAFVIQSDQLSAAWAAKCQDLTFHKATGRDHFDVLDELADENSPTFRQLQGMLS